MIDNRGFKAIQQWLFGVGALSSGVRELLIQNFNLFWLF